MNAIDLNNLPDDAILTVNDIVGTDTQAGLVSVGRTTFRRWVESGKAPKPVRRSNAGIGWKAGEIRQMLQSGKLENASKRCQPAPQEIAKRLISGEEITLHQLQREYHIGTANAYGLLERAKEIQTGLMLMRFARPRRATA